MAAPDEEAPGSGRIVVCVAMALGPRQVRQRHIQLPTGARLRDAMAAIGSDGGDGSDGNDRSDATSPDIVVGVWGRVRPLDWLLHNGDRIELSRALKLDPMEARRLRHQHQKALPKTRRLIKAETQG